MNFHNVYGDCASQVHILDTPGPTPASVRNLPFRHMARPFFPLDENIEDLEPLVLR
jgi:microcystin degradation protein MlrC